MFFGNNFYLQEVATGKMQNDPRQDGRYEIAEEIPHAMDTFFLQHVGGDYDVMLWSYFNLL
jgi:hypothetical protein